MDFEADRPIPVEQGSGTASDYHNVPVDLSMQESAEPLVELEEFGIAFENYYARDDGLNAPYYRQFASAPVSVRCRVGLARRLVAVNARLGTMGLELYVLDAFRPLACQADLWKHFMDRALLALPCGTHEELIKYGSQYCSNPEGFDSRDSRTWPTHSTGGAVDLTLRRRKTGELLFMGGVFDDAAPISHTRHYETLTSTSASHVEARRNRRLLYWAMIREGFANYPFEWWHYDFGTQMWIMNGGGDGSGAAVYGPLV